MQECRIRLRSSDRMTSSASSRPSGSPVSSSRLNRGFRLLLWRSYGRYNNVFLSDTELDELKAELPDKWEYYIDRLSTHIASKGTKYRSHAATIYKWAQEDEAKKPPKKGIPDYSCKEGESL